MRILVTGAGLLGAHITAELIRAGHHVTVVDLRPEPAYLANIAGRGAPPVRRLDVRDVAGLYDLLTAEGTEAVVHTAGLLGRKANEHPYLAFVANGATSAAVAEAAQRAGTTRLVHLSSLAVYDWPSAAVLSAVDESFSTAPRTPYAASKLAGELAVRCYAANGWLDVAVLRLAGVYGPGLCRGGAIVAELLQRMVSRALDGEPVRVTARLAQHEFLHAADAATAIRLVLEQGRSGVYNVGTGRVHSVAEVAAALRQAVPGASVETATGSQHPLPPLDTQRFRRDFPEWTPRMLATGLSELADALRAGHELAPVRADPTPQASIGR